MSLQVLFSGRRFPCDCFAALASPPSLSGYFGGLVTVVLLYCIPLWDAALCVSRVFTDWSFLSILLSLYLITYLQRMLEAKNQTWMAQQNLNGLFHNRRVNAAGAPLFIGLLPSSVAMILCGDIVKDSTDETLTPSEQAFVTSWFRHIPASTLPTYSGVLLMSSLSGVSLPAFILGMLVPMAMLALIGYLPYLRGLPQGPGPPKKQTPGKTFCICSSTSGACLRSWF